MTGAMTKSNEIGSAAPGSLLSDEEIVRRIRDGETALFEVLMRRYNQRLFRVGRAILRNEAEAEDVMQQAYVNAYAHLHQFEERARFGTWLTRIAVNEALARLHRRGRLEEVDAMPEWDEKLTEALTSKEPSPEDQALRRELRAVLESSFEAIPQIYRSVFMLREVEGLSTAEAAESLGLSEDGVKTRLHRARALLRQELFERAGLATADMFPLHLSRCDGVVAAVLARLDLPPPASPRCACPGEFCRGLVDRS
jgi:RNA polymerase sigma-70 factor (ECF subfamily)